jgi:hypothetical protein
VNPTKFFAELKRRNVYKVGDCLWRCGLAVDAGRDTSRLFEIASLLVRFDHVACIIVTNAIP